MTRLIRAAAALIGWLLDHHVQTANRIATKETR